jgi:putative ABC transport system ATP-binding protein
MSDAFQTDDGTETAPLVRVRDLRKIYAEGDRDHLVLDELDLTVERGELVVILGRSGSGKSTLLNLVGGIDRPTDGEVVIGGEHLSEESETERTLFRRRRIGFIFQAFNLIPTLTAAENVRLPLELAGRASEAERRAAELLEAVGLGGRGDSFPDRLSGGEQQRVAVARALAHDPLLILADEPTGNLDYETGRQVMSLLGRLVREQDATMLVATHDLDLLERADRVLRMHGGALKPAGDERESTGEREQAGRTKTGSEVSSR